MREFNVKLIVRNVTDCFGKSNLAEILETVVIVEAHVVLRHGHPVQNVQHFVFILVLDFVHLANLFAILEIQKSRLQRHILAISA